MERFIYPSGRVRKRFRQIYKEWNWRKWRWVTYRMPVTTSFDGEKVQGVFVERAIGPYTVGRVYWVAV